MTAGGRQVTNDRLRQQLRILLCLVWFASGCDQFFTIEARITACSSGMPVRLADAVLKLDKGYGEPDLSGRTGADGKIRMVINEPPSAWATLTIDAPGYKQWRRQFRGQPEVGLAICLEPAGAGPERTQ